MHALEVIIANNERASRRCSRCKRPHCEYPGSEVLVKERVLPADLPVRDLPNEGQGGARIEPERRLLCNACVSALVADGVEVRNA